MTIFNSFLYVYQAGYPFIPRIHWDGDDSDIPLASASSYRSDPRFIQRQGWKPQTAKGLLEVQCITMHNQFQGCDTPVFSTCL